MSEFRSLLLKTLAERGFVHRCTDAEGLDSALADRPVAAIQRFDAPEGLHAGHLIQIMSLRWAQRCGHKPVILVVGGGAGHRPGLSRYLAFGDGPTDAVLVDLGDSLDAPIPAAAVAPDPSRGNGSVLRLGGSDRWDTLAEETALARRTDPRPQFSLATPRLPNPVRTRTRAGAEGPVWLSAERLSPTAFRQAWLQVRDDDVARFLRLFTDLPLPETRRLGRLAGAALSEAKETLADAVTRLARGDAAARTAKEPAHGVGAEGFGGVDATAQVEAA